MTAETSPLETWFARRFGQPTPAQAQAWPLIRQGYHVLIVSPTGTGKTLAAFLAVLERLAREHAAGELRDSIQAVYVSPLRALSYDLEKNLRGPLHEIYGPEPPIRVALRSSDTPELERRRQFDRPPHLLLTTPESLCLLLSQPKWLPHLASVRWVIVDEIHALAENKRGAHLTLSLERLEELKRHPGLPCEAGALTHPPTAPPPASGEVTLAPVQRIGLTATVAPLAQAAGFLVGHGRDCQIVDAAATKRIELKVYTPLQKSPYPPAGFTGIRLMGELGRLIQRHRTTLVFTNTRSGAEATTFWLRESLPALTDQIECHHASLDRDVRLAVEDRLKRGELRAVVCSTSLELGIDIGSVDLVVMLATPKGVSRALQRTGRAGHSIREISRGLLMATNVGDLVECCATARLARAGHLDSLRLPEAPLDVLAQHLMGLGCTREWRRSDAFELVRRAWPYRELAPADFDRVLEYLAGGGRALRAQYTDLFGKIELNDETFEARAGSVRRDFLQNVGTIPGDGVVRVTLGRGALGTVEEGFAGGLRPGDVFILAGRPVRVTRQGSLELSVTRADGARPTVPRWNANKFPLANRIAHEIRRFRQELRGRFESLDRFEDAPGRLIPWIAERLECSPTNAAIIFRIHAAQHQFSEIPTADFLLVEELVEDPSLSSLTQGSPLDRRDREREKRMDSRKELGSHPELPGLRRKASRPAKRRPGNDRDEALPSAQCHYLFHSLIGRTANDALARVVALRLSQLRGGNAVATPGDYGFVLTVAPEQRITEADLPGLLTPDGFQAALDAALDRSNLLQHHFRNAAQTGLMVYRNYFGEQKSVRKLQFSSEVIFNVLRQHEPDHVLLREARRDACHTYLDADRARAFVEDFALHHRPFRLRTLTAVPPLSFGMMATKIREVLTVEDPQETMERLYHQWWRRLGGEADEAEAPS